MVLLSLRQHHCLHPVKEVTWAVIQCCSGGRTKLVSSLGSFILPLQESQCCLEVMGCKDNYFHATGNYANILACKISLIWVFVCGRGWVFKTRHYRLWNGINQKWVFFCREWGMMFCWICSYTTLIALLVCYSTNLRSLVIPMRSKICILIHSIRCHKTKKTGSASQLQMSTCRCWHFNKLLILQ